MYKVGPATADGPLIDPARDSLELDVDEAASAKGHNSCAAELQEINVYLEILCELLRGCAQITGRLTTALSLKMSVDKPIGL
jgi:hypothetical protein